MTSAGSIYGPIIGDATASEKPGLRVDRSAFALFEGTSPAGGIVIIGLVLWSCYCCESCPMYDHWNPRAKEKKAAAGHANYGATTAQPQIGEVVP